MEFATFLAALPCKAMSTGVPYIGSKISLITTSDIRYEGPWAWRWWSLSVLVITCMPHSIFFFCIGLTNFLRRLRWSHDWLLCPVWPAFPSHLNKDAVLAEQGRVNHCSSDLRDELALRRMVDGSVFVETCFCRNVLVFLNACRCEPYRTIRSMYWMLPWGPERQILWNRRTDRWRSRVCCSDLEFASVDSHDWTCRHEPCRRIGENHRMYWLWNAVTWTDRLGYVILIWYISHIIVVIWWFVQFLQRHRVLGPVDCLICEFRANGQNVKTIRQHEVPQSNEIYDFIIFRGKGVMKLLQTCHDRNRRISFGTPVLKNW